MAKTVAIVGAGAAGCFCAIEIKRQNPSYRVVVFEANPKAMQKLAITGGGRCNLTNSFESVNSLNEVYPRGDKLMQRLFYEFNHKDTMKWFENEGVRLVVQGDNCVFPVSQDAMQIVRTLLRLMDRYGVELLCNKRVSSIKGNNYDNEVQNATGLPRYARNDDSLYYKEPNHNDERLNYNNKGTNHNNFRHCERNEMECGNPFTIKFSDNSLFSADYVVVTAGGTKQNAIKAMLPEGIELSPTVPSLYTFKIQNPALRALMGAVVPNVQLGLVGTKFRSNGALLITDWGVSGPATLKLSSYAANYLASNTYQADLMINWLGMKEDETRKNIKH